MANSNFNSNFSDANMLLPSDLFTILVESKLLSPALSYVERERGDGSVFSSYNLVAQNFNFFIANKQGKFSELLQALCIFPTTPVMLFLSRLLRQRKFIMG